MVSLSRNQVYDGLVRMGIHPTSADLFLQYHKQRPEIWKEFERMALHLIQTRSGDFGAKEIFEHLRRGCDEIEQKGEFKLSNSFTALYARVFVLFHPEHRERIKLKAAKGPAYSGDVEPVRQEPRCRFGQQELRM